MVKILFIDTSGHDQIKVSLDINGQITKISSEPKKEKAEVLLFLIDGLLKKCHTDIKEITEIKVNPGPGSFTGIRVGLAVANTLSYTLKIPVNNKKIGNYEEAKYE
ncbi:MAG: tRNA (adenosine(37)-N6)-threonylcarbamoyltransferase complex dimerization subunit type 1 TsaB [Patescibacteria group bacterium]